MPRKKREALSLDLLDSVGMRSFSKRRPHELSGGEKQRIALARTLATRPRVILFDEPLSSLDTALRKHLRAEIREQQRRAGLTALYVTHDLEEAMTLADNVAVMGNGSILQCAAPKELWQRPANTEVVRFLGNGPCLPVLRFESSEGVMIASTDTGRFGIKHDAFLAGRQSMSLLHVRNGLPPKAFIFFERTAVRPLTHEEALQVRMQDGFGLFKATCLRTDFAGDVVDCMLQAGQATIPIRLPPDNSPVPGESLQCLVDTEKIHLIMDPTDHIP
jgi:ABC-type Fe3+/spermidine/putrescine transport system ATPase subunit